jgi:hypothetical protein
MSRPEETDLKKGGANSDESSVPQRRTTPKKNVSRNSGFSAGGLVSLYPAAVGYEWGHAQ